MYNYTNLLNQNRTKIDREPARHIINFSYFEKTNLRRGSLPQHES